MYKYGPILCVRIVSRQTANEKMCSYKESFLIDIHENFAI